MNKIKNITMISLVCCFCSTTQIVIPENLNDFYNLFLSYLRSAENNNGKLLVNEQSKLYLFYSTQNKEEKYKNRLLQKDYEIFRDSLNVNKTISFNLFTNLIDKNQKTIKIPLKTDLSNNIYIFPNSEIIKIKKNSTPLSSNDFKGNYGILNLSIPVIDLKSGYGMIFYSEFLGSLASTGYIILFKIQSNKFIEIKKMNVWCS